MVNGQENNLLWRGAMREGQQIAMAVQCDMVYQRLLDWADDNDGDLAIDDTLTNASGACRLVHVADVGGPAGRGLVASRDLEPGEVLISVPFERVLKSKVDGGGLGGGGIEDDGEGSAEPVVAMHWAAGMALRLLEARNACRGLGDSGEVILDQPGGNRTDGQWCTWIDALPGPDDLRTPLGFSGSEVQALGDPGVIQEVLAMQECIRACYDHAVSSSSSKSSGSTSHRMRGAPESNQMSSWEDFLWAVQVSLWLYGCTLMRQDKLVLITV